MKIILNGEPQELEQEVNLSAFLLDTGYADKLVAVAVNNHFVAKPSYGEHVIKDGDRIEIVAPMQGG